ncbi:Malonate-semialdehyde dehydrogenase [Streptomyces badius]
MSPKSPASPKSPKDPARTRRLTTAQALVAFLARQYTERDGRRQRLISATWGIFGHGNVAGIGQALVEAGHGGNGAAHRMPYLQGRNEQAMVHAAVGYARQSGRLSAQAVTTSIGPGATNLVTGAALATINRLPVLLLPGDTFATRPADPVLQQLEVPYAGDVSVNDCLRPVSRYFDRITRPEALIPAALQAMRVLADPAETGAVTLALPQDVQTEAYDWPEEFFAERDWHIRRPAPDPHELDAAVRAIRSARRPLIVHGDKVAVDALLAHPDVAAVSFVGSTPIARYIHATASANGKRVQALGGAKNHMLVLPDADLDAAADAAVSAAYGSAGERCMAISAVVAVGAIGDELVAKIRERAEKIKIGPGNDPTSEMGPLITAAHRDKVASYVTGAAAQGAEVVLDGTGLTVEGFEDGHWIGLSLLDKVSTDSDAYKDEIFGPVLCVLRVDTYEDGVALMNASPFGNGTAIFTRDGGAARRFQLEVEAGMVGVNVPIPVPVGYHSFGGWKDSLFGDHHIYGNDGVHFYTRGKVVTTRWPDPADAPAGVDLGFPRNH